jgi:hypothetical protein
MPRFDFEPPLTFLNAFEQYALAHHAVMVALRNEVKFGDGQDTHLLNAVGLFCSLLEDSHAETDRLIDELERRASKRD